jgi:hypothetical protein
VKKHKTLLGKDGRPYQADINLKKLLNLNYLELTNKGHYSGEFDIPAACCKTEVYPDYVALYSEKGDYRKTERTAVGFFEYDNEFDGQRGLYNAIYYRNEADLKKYRARFDGVRYFIHPEYSTLGDIDEAENINRLKKSRVVGLWFVEELHAVSIPVIMFPSLDRIGRYLAGLEESEVVAISTKSHISDPAEYRILCEAVKVLVESLNLRVIVVYDVCGDPSKTLQAFEPATKAGIKVIIPENSLKLRNEAKWRKNHEAL